MFFKPNIRELYDHIFGIKSMNWFQRWIYKIMMRIQLFRGMYIFYEKDLILLKAIFEKINYMFLRNNNDMRIIQNGDFLFNYKDRNNADITIVMGVEEELIKMHIKYNKCFVTCKLNNDFDTISRISTTDYYELTAAELWYLKCNTVLNNILMKIVNRFL